MKKSLENYEKYFLLISVIKKSGLDAVNVFDEFIA
jgi:hypothetical protein